MYPTEGVFWIINHDSDRPMQVEVERLRSGASVRFSERDIGVGAKCGAIDNS